MVKAYTELIHHSGNKTLFRAVEMSILAMQVNRPLHIHVEGLRGTGKTTIMRAARDLLPPIQRICGCKYNCHPLHPHCPEHFNLTPDEITAIGIEQIPMPFLEISHSAKIGTVVGSIDLTKLTDAINPTACIMPGTIPQAHRGIIFVDEINRMADTSPDLADVLLDVMGTKPGRIQIEETGLPIVQIPVQVSIWSASNPDEEPGPLEHVRRQLSDRFDMVVRMGRPTEMDAVNNILQQSQTYRTNPRQVICPNPSTEIWQQQQRLRTLSTVFDEVSMNDEIKNIIANIYLDYGLESLRAVEGMELGCRVHAALQGRKNVLVEDMTAIVPLVLAHRVDLTKLENILKYLDFAHFSQSVPTLPTTLQKPSESRIMTGSSVVASPPLEQGESKWETSSPKGLRHMLQSWLKKLKSHNDRHEKQPVRNQSASAYNSSCKSDPSPYKRGNSQMGGQNTVGDPNKMPIRAPGEKARPLTELSVKQYIRSEEEMKDKC
jgi:magnesium chelatase subunit I